MRLAGSRNDRIECTDRIEERPDAGILGDVDTVVGTGSRRLHDLVTLLQHPGDGPSDDACRPYQQNSHVHRHKGEA